MKEPVDVKHLGKLMEELGEAQAAVARCLIQGINEAEPITGKLNGQWLAEELADVEANIALVRKWFDINPMGERVARKMKDLRRWHEMLT